MRDLELVVKLRGEGLTWKEIAEKVVGDTPNALRKAYYRYVRSENKTKPTMPKILVLDIETLPMEAWVWGLFDQNIGLDMVKTDWSILSYAAKWLGAPESEVMYYDTREEKDVRNDFKLLKSIHSLLDEADVVLYQNGDRFDRPKLFTRFALSGLGKPSSFRSIDTLKIAKKNFKFTSNKLAYMTDKFCTKYKKLSHSDYPGFSMWKACMEGDIKAFNSMKKYNIYDILSLEELYGVLSVWDNTINFSVYSNDTEYRCNCGSNEFKIKGFVYTNTAKYQRYICKGCGKESRDNVNLLTKEKRASVRR